MGSSSWVTDVKNRQNDAAAANIAGIEGDYMSTLYGALLDRLGQQEANKLSVDQFNATARQNALAQAICQTDKWWQTWKKEQEPKKSSGRVPTVEEEDDLEAYRKYLSNMSADYRQKLLAANLANPNRREKSSVVNTGMGARR
jgi:hypothetical protein